MVTYFRPESRPLIPRIACGPLSTQRGWAVFGIKPLVAVAAAEWVGNLVDGLLVHAAGWVGGVLLPVELQALGGEGAFCVKHPVMTPPCWQKSLLPG